MRKLAVLFIAFASSKLAKLSGKPQQLRLRVCQRKRYYSNVHAADHVCRISQTLSESSELVKANNLESALAANQQVKAASQ